MISREYIKDKIEALPDESLEEILDFIEFLQAKRGQSRLAEYGMESYLNELSSYESMLADGKVNWK